MTGRITTTGAVNEVHQQTMRAMVQEEYGPASDVLEMREVPVPAIGARDLLVRVHSSSVNALEWHLTNGKPYVFRAAFGLSPRSPTPGADISGTVVEVGPDVTRFTSGDEVFGSIGSGAYAEYAGVSETLVVPKPANVSFEAAAAAGVAGLTALQGLRDVGGLGSGESVLINGASGGVGTYAIQVARALGAHVTAVVSTRNVGQARDLGADVVIDYQKEDVTEAADRFEVIFDIPGNQSLRKLKRMLAPGGTYVMVGGPKHDWSGPLFRLIRGKFVFALGGKRDASFTAEPRAEDLATLGQWLESGQIRSVIEDTFPLGDVAIALDRQGQFHARAKTVINIEGTL